MLTLHPNLPRRSLCPRAMPGILALALTGLVIGAVAEPVSLAPQYSASVATAAGAEASFVQIDGSWQGSTVLWNEATRSYGSGQAIGSFSWGTGLWGRADWHTIQQTVLGTAAAGAPTIVNQWAGQVAAVNHGNALYNELYSQAWGPAELVPFFGAEVVPQENWASRFAGVIRVEAAGAYDFSVLNDDGFFMRLLGAQGEAVEFGRDFLNPRDRTGLGETLWLTEGLYGFEIGAWNRLEAGVVDLRWIQPGTQEWSLVPVERVVPTRAVSAPGTLGISLLGLLALAGLARVRQRTGQLTGATR